ncbi:unnamed protein product [Ixodes pacificus]
MRRLYLVAFSILALSAQICSGRPQLSEDVTNFEFNQDDSVVTESSQNASDYKGTEVTVIGTLKDISQTLKSKFIAIGDKIKDKLHELNQAYGDQAEKIKAELKRLKQQLKDSIQALKEKVQDLFRKSQYASLCEHASNFREKIVEIRDRLNEFMKAVKDITGDKLRQMQELAKKLRKQIKIKIQEHFCGSGNSQVALYHLSDDDNNEDNEAYVIATLKDVSKTIKERFLIIVEQLKQKFSELKQVGLKYTEEIKMQIQILKKKLADSVEAIKQKVGELLNPAQYASLSEHMMKVIAKMANLRETLRKLKEEVKRVSGEKLAKLKEIIKETRQKIREHIQELIYGSSYSHAALYHESDDDHEKKDDEACFIATLEEISKTLKDKLLIPVVHLKQIFAELKQVGGEHAEKVKAQIQNLKEKVADVREEIKPKVQALVKPTQYASFKEHTMETFRKLRKIQEKLFKFLADVQEVTADKAEALEKLIKKKHQEIRENVKELIGYRRDKTALCQASDGDKYAEAYIVDTLKAILKTLKETFLVLGAQIADKVNEIKEAVGERATVLKTQLEDLKGQLGEAAGDLKKKVLEIVRPEKFAPYGLSDDLSSAVLENLATLMSRLQSFLDKAQKLAWEKWVKMEENIRELRSGIKQSIEKLELTLHTKDLRKITSISL